MSKRGFVEEYNPDDSSKRSRSSNTTRVVFVRGIPHDAEESELLAICSPFAVVEETLLIPQKGQAFVQLPDVASATNLVEFYKARPATIRNSTVHFEFSAHEEITKKKNYDNNSSSNNRRGGDSSENQQRRGVTSDRGTPHHPRGPGVPNYILMVTVTNLEYEMTIDTLEQVFSKYGKVIKLVQFDKNDSFNALVQMDSVSEADAAQAALDNRDIYTGCNTLNIIFSKHSELRVRCNNDKTRDFTNPNLPREEPSGRSLDQRRPSGMLGDAPPPRDTRYPPSRQDDDYHHHHSSSAPPYNDRRPPSPHHYRGDYRGDTGPYDDPYSSYDNRGPPPPGRMIRHDDSPRRGGGPPPMRRDNGPPPPPSRGYDDVPPSRRQRAPSFDGPSPHSRGYDDVPPGRRQRDPSFDGPPMYDDYYHPRDRMMDRRGGGPMMDDRRGGGPPPMMDDRRGGPRRGGPPPMMDSSPVIICSNIADKLCNPAAIFAFFGCFGNVIRVKIMHKKGETALIQFSDPIQARDTVDMLDGLLVFGKKLRVDVSRHFNIGMPRRDNPDPKEVESCVDYSNSPLHRYMYGKNFNNIIPPCPGLHVSGISPKVQGDTAYFTKLFSEHGEIVKCAFFEKDNRMCMIDMKNLDDAINCIINLDNFEAQGHHIRVAFSKAYLRQRNRR